MWLPFQDKVRADLVYPRLLEARNEHVQCADVGLLNTRNLVQDEKLVVATLASLNSGDPSNIIKQDLRLIIQSRRKAEGKGELTVDFKSPPKDEQLTSEELEKRARRRELNRLAAKRSREKGQRRKDSLIQEIQMLQARNMECECAKTSLVEERDSLVETLRGHLPRCHDPVAIARSAQLLAFSRRLAHLLDCALPLTPGTPVADRPPLDQHHALSVDVAVGGEAMTVVRNECPASGQSDRSIWTLDTVSVTTAYPLSLPAGPISDTVTPTGPLPLPSHLIGQREAGHLLVERVAPLNLSKRRKSEDFGMGQQFRTVPRSSDLQRPADVA
nr:hypothetical protein BaRGS_035135 [Batillaria attramentaria]